MLHDMYIVTTLPMHSCISNHRWSGLVTMSLVLVITGRVDLVTMALVLVITGRVDLVTMALVLVITGRVDL